MGKWRVDGSPPPPRHSVRLRRVRPDPFREDEGRGEETVFLKHIHVIVSETALCSRARTSDFQQSFQYLLYFEHCLLASLVHYYVFFH